MFVLIWNNSDALINMKTQINLLLMKIALLILVLFSLNFQSQNYYFKFPGNIEGRSFDDNIKRLNDDILRTYKNSDKIKFNDNIFRLYILSGDYKKGLFYLNELKSFPKYKGLDYQEIIGIQFELYALSKLSSENKPYRDKFENTFNGKINSISDKSKVYLGEFYRHTQDALKNDILKFIKTDVVNDSISGSNALKLCRYYISYVIAKETNHIALPLIKKLDREEYAANDSVIIKTKSGNEISLGFLKHKKGENKVPTILNFSIYNGELSHDERLNSLKGYAMVKAYSRGVYLSHDQITPFEFETEDVNEVIDWIIKQSWSNGKVGMIGGSYDGFSQWAAAKNLHPALKTIIPSASVGFGIDFPMENHVFNTYMIRWAEYVIKSRYSYYDDSNTEKWKNLVNNLYKKGCKFRQLDILNGSTNPIFQKWVAHPSFDTFWQSKIPYKEDFSKINIPVLTFTGYFDDDQLGALYYYNEHYKYNKNANHYLVIGPYDHYGSQGNIKDNLRGYEIDEVAKINMDELSYQWFDYILKEKKKPAFLKDRVNYQVMGSNQWKSAASIDKISNNKLKLFLNKAKLQKAKSKLNFTSQKIDLSDRRDTLQNFERYKILDTMIDDRILKEKLVFETDMFDKSFEINGSFTGNIKLSVNKKDLDISIKLYELTSNGKYLLLSSYLGRASYSRDREKRQLLIPEKIEKIPIQNTYFVSKKIEKGSKLLVVLGVNKDPYCQINYGTGKDVSEETIEDAKEPLEIKWYNDSYIEIPVM